ncbi:MAG: RNA polymerase sigma factor [Candidatus Aminicenantes bacterium]|nr:RNA polymerase sigma factor [Candidatus Aminicenantes bacterium]
MINFKDLYESYANEVYRFALWLTGNPSEAEDITSETFIRAWVNNSKIRTETLKAYLFTISRNIYLQHQRKMKHQAVLEDIHPDSAPGPEKLTESQFILKRVQRILQTLPETDRTTFVLRVHHGLSYEEISRVLEISLSALKVKIYRVRKKLINAFIDKED